MVHCGKWSCSLDLLLDLLWASNFVTLDGHVVKLYLYIYVNIYIQCTGLCSQRLFHFLQFRCLDKEICSDFCAVSLPLIFGMLPSDSHPHFFKVASNYLLQVLIIKLWLLHKCVQCCCFLPKKTDVWMQLCLFSPVVFGFIKPPFQKISRIFYFHPNRHTRVKSFVSQFPCIGPWN